MRILRAAALILFSVTAIHAARLAAQQANDTSAGPPPITDPLAKELERCKQLNERAASDERCEAAYKESRKQFFQPPADYHPAPAHIDPNVPEPKLVKPDQPQNQ
jgi:conjugative transfer region protein TrbK